MCLQVMAIKERETTKQGFEKQLGCNHFGHFAFLTPLLPHLKAQVWSRRWWQEQQSPQMIVPGRPCSESHEGMDLLHAVSDAQTESRPLPDIIQKSRSRGSTKCAVPGSHESRLL